MNPTTPSIFDLSPSEKLELVQDLWDDLASTPDAVPVHDRRRDVLNPIQIWNLAVSSTAGQPGTDSA